MSAMRYPDGGPVTASAKVVNDWNEIVDFHGDAYAVYRDSGDIQFLGIIVGAHSTARAALEDFLRPRVVDHGDEYLVLWIQGGGITRYRWMAEPKLVRA